MINSDVMKTRIPHDLKTAFDEVLEAESTTASKVIRDLIEDYVLNKSLQKQRRLETLEALEDIAAGKTVDGTDVMKWMSSWGSENELEPPTCK